MKFLKHVAYAGAVASLLAACSASTPVEPNPAAEQQSATPQVTQTQGKTETLTVMAAASLGSSFDELIAEFTKEHPNVEVLTSYEGSQDLVAHLADGAEADILATANTKTMKKAQEQDLVKDPTTFAFNTLTLIVPKGNPAGVTGGNETLDNAQLVICAAEVPCGTATRSLAEELGVTFTPVSEENKVTDVRAKVESGEADAGIVYLTDAKKAGDKVEIIPLPSNTIKNEYPIALTASSKNQPTAQAFIELVLSDKGRKILESYGFTTP